MEQTLIRSRRSLQQTTALTYQRNYDPTLAEYVCWSRMQAEAGQSLDAIVSRKEHQRRAGGGLFLWGVGNAPPASMKALAHMGREIPVIFSIMKTKPRAIDAAPARTVIWRRYVDSSGRKRPFTRERAHP